MALTAGTIAKGTKAQKAEMVAALDRDGFAPLRSGLGVPPGKYQFTSGNAEVIFAIKPIETAKGKFGLTLIAGTLKGAEPTTQHINNVYGLESTDKQMVVTLDQFMGVEQNQTYNVTVGANFRIADFVLASAVDNVLPVNAAPVSSF